MLHLGIIAYLGNNEYFIRLTTEGHKAANSGMKSYFKALDEHVELEVQTMRATIKASKWNKWSIIINFTFTAITIILTILITIRVIGK